MPEYFSLAELTAMPNVGTDFADPVKEAAAAYVVAVIEGNVGTSFVERTVTDEVHSGTRANRQNRALALTHRYPREVTALAVDGVALTGPELAEVDVVRGVVQRFDAGSSSPVEWSPGRRNILVTYTRGYSDVPPADVKDAALQATRYRLLTTRAKTGVSDRATSITNEMGNVHLATAGKDGAFGLPEVDEVVARYRRALRGPMVR